MNEVSVIIAAYNASKTIGETFESLFAQTHTEWEAIVIDDGSTDDTVSVVRSFMQRDHRIRLVRQQRGRQSLARNAGIAESRYEWLLFLDADDWISPQHLQRMTEELGIHPELDAVVSGSARVAMDGTPVVETYLPPPGDLFHILARRSAFPNHACVVRKSVVESAGKFDPSFVKSEDWDMWQRVARTGARFGVIPDVLAFYRMQANSSSLDAEILLRDGLRVLRQGRTSDPRVSNAHPDHVAGIPAEASSGQEYYLLCWCAGLLLGNGKDGRVLLQQVAGAPHSGLDPIAIAKCIFDSAALPVRKSPKEWYSLAVTTLFQIDEFLAALETQSKVPGLAHLAGNGLRKMILSNSVLWCSFLNQREEELRQKEATIASFAKEIKKNQESIASLNVDLRSLAQAAESLNKRIDGLEVERDSLHRTIQDQDVELQNRDARISDLHKEKEEWKSQAEEDRWILSKVKKTGWVRLGNSLGLFHTPSPVSMQDSSFLKILGESAKTKEFLILTVGLMVSVLSHALFYWMDQAKTALNVSGIVVAAINLLVGILVLLKSRVRYLILIAILYAAQLGILALKLGGEDFSTVPRLFQVAVTLFSMAIVLTVALASFRVTTFYKAAALSLGIAVTLFAWEGVQDISSSTPTQGVEWVGTLSPHATLEKTYYPHSIVKSYYPGNDRSYFPVENRSEAKWWLRTDAGGWASLVFPRDKTDSVRIDIKSAPSGKAYDIQLNLPHISIRKFTSYKVRYRARSDVARKIYVGFARSHDPWDNLGLYAQIDLGPQWKNFEHEFRATSDDYNARILFDVGEKAVPVEIGSVTIQDLSNQKYLVTEDSEKKRYVVTYEFNSKGCRGQDYPIPKPEGTYRIVVLGQAFALGVGVLERDTTSSRLEVLLNDEAKRSGSTEKYEVINCGTNVSANDRDAIFYQLFAGDYAPDMVFQVVTPVYRQVQFGAIGTQLNLLTGDRPSPHLTTTVDEVIQLDSEVKKKGSRLLVGILRPDSDFSGTTNYGRIWNALINNFTQSVHQKSSDIPILVLGKHAYSTNRYEDLITYKLIDEHPNEIVHREVAQELFEYLMHSGLLPRH